MWWLLRLLYTAICSSHRSCQTNLSEVKSLAVRSVQSAIEVDGTPFGVRCLILPWLGVSLLDGDKTRFSFMLLLQPHALACVVHLRSRKLQFSDNFPIEITEYLLLSSKSCKSDLQGCKSSYFLLFPYSSDLYNRDSSYFALKFIYYVNSRTRSTIQIE